ncbi:uncharacterized protein LOC115881608 isoform X2 [Sitophilus oryzae]|uniref:Uncharacterized protein LOC115881608 isoform X2 n=1 Tax=Sitophilus oryzae TaxID=7048 RepID=A0A6J2XTY5_SITOR|nr:uncharacterized protein LOC115881608 isoform X2 [Sitophilus oryzae]
MALRTSKITSEVIQTCNKYISSKSEAIVNASSQAANINYYEHRTGPSYRYKIKTTEKPKHLPEIKFEDPEESHIFSELQPAAGPLFRFDYRQAKWSDDMGTNSPFPAKIETKGAVNVVYSDMQKAEDKLLKSKISVPSYRHYSSLSNPFYGRAPAENNSEGKCHNKLNKCVKLTKPKNCKLSRNCPRYKLDDCEQSPGSNCKLNYLDPNCTKKYAPYPAYSESCAENLPEDPSECQQCPWRTCDGADTIEPGKPVRGRRNYSTSTTLQRSMVNGVVTPGPHTPPINAVREYLCGKGKKCGIVKSPCTEPPGPCEVRRQKEESEGRKNKKQTGKKKRCVNMVLRDGDLGVGDEIINPYTMERVKLEMNGSWMDLPSNNDIEQLLMCEKKQKPPNCRKGKKPKRPKENAYDNTDIEYGDVDWWSGRGKKSVVTEPLEGKCEPPGCRKQTIRSKQEMTKKTWRKKDKIKDQVKSRK